MNNGEFKERLLAFCDEIFFSESLETKKASIGHGVKKVISQSFIEKEVPGNWFTNFDNFFGTTILWEAKHETGINAFGKIKIMNLLEIFDDGWEGITYFDFTPEDSIVRDLKIVDFYSEENAVGIFFGKFTDFTFYNAELDGSMPRSLDLNISGYIEMLIESKGYAGWQEIIEYLIGNNHYTDRAEEFKENMPKLFPDWTWESFVKKFEAVRLNKVK